MINKKMPDMRHIKILILLLTVILGTVTARAVRPVFADLPAGEEVEKVYISKTLLRMAGAADNIALPGVNINGFGLSVLDNVEVVNIDNRRFFKQANEILDRYISTEGLDVMMLKEGDGEKVIIYSKQLEKTDALSVMIIVKEDEDEMNIVVIHGRIDISYGIDF